MDGAEASSASVASRATGGPALPAARSLSTGMPISAASIATEEPELASGPPAMQQRSLPASISFSWLVKNRMYHN
ncbi:MAG TPA: hypothetical protein VN729_03365 [Ktedonobacteraceae bacterium]|nr:hypothetical protein [Ktedonobacteraceae bacterium]